MRMGYVILLIATILLVAMFPNSSDTILYVALGFAGLFVGGWVLSALGARRSKDIWEEREWGPLERRRGGRAADAGSGMASAGGESSFFSTAFILVIGAILGALLSTPVNKGMCLHVSALWCQETAIVPKSDP